MLDLLGSYIIGCKCPAGCLVGVKILQLTVDSVEYMGGHVYCSYGHEHGHEYA